MIIIILTHMVYQACSKSKQEEVFEYSRTDEVIRKRNDCIKFVLLRQIVVAYQEVDIGMTDIFEQKSRQYIKTTDTNGFKRIVKAKKTLFKASFLLEGILTSGELSHCFSK